MYRLSFVHYNRWPWQFSVNAEQKFVDAIYRQNLVLFCYKKDNTNKFKERLLIKNFFLFGMKILQLLQMNFKNDNDQLHDEFITLCTVEKN